MLPILQPMIQYSFSPKIGGVKLQYPGITPDELLQMSNTNQFNIFVDSELNLDTTLHYACVKLIHTGKRFPLLG